MTLRHFIGESALYGAANIVARGMVFLLLPLYTQVLSQAEVGAFEWLTALSLPLLVLLPMEITQALARLRTQKLRESNIQLSARSALGYTILVVGIFVGVVSTLLHLRVFQLPLEQMPPNLPFFALLFLLVNCVMVFVQNELRWTDRAKYYAWTSIVSAAATAICALVFLLVFDMGVYGLYFAMILGMLSGVCVALYHLPYLLKPRLKWSEISHLLGFSFPLAVSSVAIILASIIERLFLAHFLDVEALGLYGIGMRIAMIVPLLLNGFQLAVLPVTLGQGSGKHREKLLEQSFRFFLLIAVSMALMLSASAPWALRILFAEQYWSAETFMPIVLVGCVCNAVYPFAPGLWLKGKSYMMATLGIALVLVGFVSSWVLIPWIGIDGAAMAFTITGIVYAFLMFWISDHVFPVGRNYPRLLFAVATFIIAAVCLTGMAMESWNVFVRIVFVMFTIVPVALLLSYSDERKLLYQWVLQLKFSKNHFR